MTLPQWWSGAFAELERLAVRLEARSETVPTGVGLRSETSGAKAASTQILTDPDNNRRYRRMRLRNIPVPCPSDQGLHPTGARLSDATVSILYELWEETKGFVRFNNEPLDRIRRADLQVRVSGAVTYGARTVAVEDHWRVDTHHFSQASVDPHPWIHYQRGGHAQDVFAAVAGFLPGECLTQSLFDPDVPLTGLMQSPAPRIATPPLDPICAIDFVLAQHRGSLWAKLWSDVDYAGLISTAQGRLWEPWFEALNDKKQRRHLMPFYGSPSPVVAG